MANTTIAAAGVEHNREAERALWSHYGLEPTERFVDIESPAVRLRLLEVGSGEPVLFVHGTMGPAWAPLVRAMLHERGMVQAIVSPTGWRFGLTFDDAELAAIRQPTLLVYGTADPVGSVETWSRFIDLLPNGELRLLDDFGHQPWLDDPSGVAGHVGRFLTRIRTQTEDPA